MKNLVRLATSALLIAAIFGLAIPMSVRSREASLGEPGAKGVKDFKVKTGAEVAAKVRKFKESSENVRAALRYFDKKGKPSKIDKAFSITGTASSSKTTTASINNSLIRPASFIKPSSFASQDFTEGNVELIFVPDYDTQGEWQGTVIANRYDEYGGLLEQYVAQRILVTPDPSSAAWDEVYEAPVFGGEVQSPISEPGMYTDYNWGTTRDQQPTDYMMMTKADSHNRAQTGKVVFAQSRRARVRPRA